MRIHGISFADILVLDFLLAVSRHQHPFAVFSSWISGFAGEGTLLAVPDTPMEWQAVWPGDIARSIK